MASIADLISNLKKKLTDGYNQAADALPIVPNTKQIQSIAPQIQNNLGWAGNQIQQNVIKPFTLAGANLGSRIQSEAQALPRYTSNVVQGIKNPQSVQANFDLLRQNSPNNLVSRFGTNLVANAGESAFAGLNKINEASKMYQQNKFNPAAYIKGGMGIAQVIAPTTPFFQGATAIQGAGQTYKNDFFERLATGGLRGQTGANINPQLKEQKINTPVGSFDPVTSAGSLYGFTKNPAWDKIFKNTGNINKLVLNKNPLLNYLITRGAKGSAEGAIQGGAEWDRSKPLVENLKDLGIQTGFGALSEVAMDKLSEKALEYGGKAASKTLKLIKDNTMTGSQKFYAQTGMVGNVRSMHPADISLLEQIDTVINEPKRFNEKDVKEATDLMNLLAEKYLPNKDQSPSGDARYNARQIYKRMRSGNLKTFEGGYIKLDEPIFGTGQKVRSKDRGNVGTVWKVNDDGTVKVKFTNRKEGTTAFVNKPASLLEPIGTQPKSQKVKVGQKGVQTGEIQTRIPTAQQGVSRMGEPSVSTQMQGVTTSSQPLSQVSGDLTTQSGQIEPQKGTQLKEVQKPQTGLSDVSSQPYFNTERLNVDENAKNLVQQSVKDIKPQIEKAVGTKLSNSEVVDVANRSAQVLNSVVDRQKTLDWEAALLNTRRKLASMAQDGVVTQDYLDTLLALKTNASDTARKLQSFSIGADPKLVTAKEAILEAVLQVEKDTSKVLDASKGVNFNDYKQAAEFYRQFVKPTAGDWITLLRYNSMLSSPNTHINNAASNFQGTGIIAPVEKTITGIVDKIASAVTGKERSFYTGEGAAYAKGYYSNIGKATQRFVDVMRGNKMIENPDTRELPLATKGAGKYVEGALKPVMSLLEASDQFFSALTEGGSEASLNYRVSRGGKISDIGATARDEAAKRLFRSELGDNNGSVVLDAVDTLANTVQRLKNSKNPLISNIAKFTLPFVKTPTNLLKQGIEYSPLGVTTMPGSRTKTEQLSKMIIGSSIAASTALLATTDKLTWAEPTSEKQKQMFRAAGMQPYSIKIGDNWVSYSKLHPAISFNIALVAAVKDSLDNKRLSESEADTVLNGLAKWVNFYADQSYLKNIGDFVAGVKGDVEGMAKIPANYTQQLIPYRALLGWVTRLVDPYQRKVDKDGSILDKQLQQIATQIPLLSQTVPARLDQNDKPIENQNRLLNAFSPAKVTTEVQPQKQEYLDYRLKLKNDRDVQDVRDSLKGNTNGTSNGLYKEVSGQTGVFVVKLDNGDTKKIDLSKPIEAPSLTGNTELDKKLISKYNSKLTSRASDIASLFEAGQIKADEAEKMLSELMTKKISTAKGKTIKIGKVPKIKTPKVKLAKVKSPKIKIPKLKLARAKAVKLKLTKPKNTKIKLAMGGSKA